MNYSYRHEKYFFYLLVFLHLLPVISFHLFPTVDGPAHLYNSNLINSLLFSKGSTAATLFQLNTEPEPNWLGHILLCVFNSFLPSWLAEKFLLVIYVILLPVSFRLFLLKLKPDAMFMTYLIFPFIYSFVFYTGFFNFCLSIPLYFLSLFYWLKRKDNFKIKHVPVFALLLLLLFSAHIFSFLFFLATAGALLITDFIRDKSQPVSEKLKKHLPLFISALPALILTINFLVMKAGTGKVSYVDKGTLLTGLKEADAIITLNHDNEAPYTSVIFYLFAFILLFIIAERIYQLIKLKLPVKQFFNSTDTWLTLSLLVFILYLTMPNAAASGGYISIRIQLFLFLTVLTWLGIQIISVKLQTVYALIAICISCLLLKQHYSDSKLLSKDAEEMYSVAENISEQSTVLPIGYGDNWMHANFASYIGSEKKIIILDNYEASTPHFPLKWKENACPYNVLSNSQTSNRPWINLDQYENVSGIKVNYILRWQYKKEMNDSSTTKVNELLSKEFNLVYTSPEGNAELFKRATDFTNSH